MGHVWFKRLFWTGHQDVEEVLINIMPSDEFTHSSINGRGFESFQFTLFSA